MIKGKSGAVPKNRNSPLSLYFIKEVKDKAL